MMTTTRAAFYRLAFCVMALHPLCGAWAQDVERQALPMLPPFEDMLTHVYQENPQLKSERDSLRVLDERVSQASAGFRPSLTFNGEIGEARVSEENAAWQYGQDRNLALVATQPVYNGATIGQWHAAKERVMEGRARLAGVEQKIFLTAITSWLDMYEKEKLVTLTADNARITQKYLEATRERLSAGDGTETDIAVAESRAADGETRYEMAKAGYTTSRVAYERATGLPPQSPTLAPIPANLPANGDEARELAKENPDLTQANYEVAATDDDVESAEGARLPFIFLRATVSDERAQDLGLERLRSDSITINASFPLYQGGAEFSREREAEIAHEKSRYDSITTSRNVSEEAQEAWNRFHVAQSVIQASDRAASASDRALAGIEEEQKRGTRTLTEVLDAEAQSLNAKITALQAQTDLRLAAYRLMAAVGRLTTQGLELPITAYDPVAHYDDVAARWFGTSIENK